MRHLAAVVVLLLPALVRATTSVPERGSDRRIRFESGALDPTRDASIADAAAAVGNVTFVVQLQVATESERRRLSSQYGAVAGGYVPDAAYLFYGTAAQMQALRTDPAVLWAGTLPPHLKLSLTLSASPPSSRSRFFSVPDLGDPIPQLVVSLTAADSGVPPRLRAVHGVRAVRAVTRTRLLLDVDVDEQIGAVAESVARDPAVHWVERRLRHQFLNRWARSLMQRAGANTTADYAARTGLPSWDHGLDGEGQVLALGDSGLDKRSCFFASQADAVPTTSRTPSRTSRLYPVHERTASSDKIVAYVGLADTVDATGHGTHLAGTMAGDPHLPDGVRGTLPTFAGMAPRARLAIVDIGDRDGVVQLPADLATDYFQPMYETGARIMTSAWGAPHTPLYTHEAADIDTYMYEAGDFLVVTAVGNDGACNDEQTVVSPATAKNAVAVGATLSLPMQYLKTDLIPPGFQSAADPHLSADHVAAFSSKGPTRDGRIKPDVLAPGYFVYSAASGLGPNGCDGELGAIVTPNAGTSTAAAVVAGTTALIRQYLTDGFYPGGRRDPRHGFVPSAALLKALLIHGARLLNGTRQVGDDGIADPARCPRTEFVPLRDDDTRDGGDDDDDDVPNIDQGWGRPQLDQVLSFLDQDTLHVLGRNNKSAGTFGDPEIGPGQQHRYRFCVLESQTSVRTTLVWTDPAATLGSGLQLVNDLDLVLDLNTGPSRDGNGAPDRRNPVERARVVTRRPLSDLTVVVHARRVAIGLTQPYALVLTGHGVRPGPCRPHHEMMRVLRTGTGPNNADAAAAAVDERVLDGAVRLFNTARGLRSQLLAAESATTGSMPSSSSAGYIWTVHVGAVLLVAVGVLAPLLYR